MEILNEVKASDRAGKCFLLSLIVVLFEPGGEGFCLCHGTVYDGTDDGVLRHAWVDTGDGFIFDPVLDRSMAADAYLEHATVEHKYSRAQALRLATEFSTCGPWA